MNERKNLIIVVDEKKGTKKVSQCFAGLIWLDDPGEKGWAWSVGRTEAYEYRRGAYSKAMTEEVEEAEVFEVSEIVSGSGDWKRWS